MFNLTSSDCLNNLMKKINKGDILSNEDLIRCQVKPSFGESISINLKRQNNYFFVNLKYQNKMINICRTNRKNMPYVCSKLLTSRTR